MSIALHGPESLIPHLYRCGYGDDQIERSFKVDQFTIPVAAFAGRPFDSWSACIAAVNLNGDSKASAAKTQMFGASTVFVCGPQGVDWWAMGPAGPTTKRPIAWNDVGGVLGAHKDQLAPSRIYTAKLRRPDCAGKQLWFFDEGLMAAVEKNRGETLLRLVEDAVDQLHAELGARLHSRQAQEDVYRTVFWLLAAKVLHDKKVENFIRIDLRSVEEVFDRIGRHHGETNRFPPFGKEGRGPIDGIAATFANCGSLADVSSESIAYVYENALIDKTAGSKSKVRGEGPYDIRKELGIHGTPSVLVHHMLSQAWGMIEDIEPEQRNVFEPACGHAPFLTAAMRWMRVWGPGGRPVTTHDYLRSHLLGLEADGFAIELAKLALTLADEPYGNSWRLAQNDMFLPQVLAKHVRKASILLANPPYEAFTPAQKALYAKEGEPVVSSTKATELLLRTLPHLPPGGVFGVVVPQGLLYQDEALQVRKLLVTDYEISEVALFADNLFDHGDAETAILIGRRKKSSRGKRALWYRRVREKGMEAFKERLAFSSEREIAQGRFRDNDTFDLRVPDLEELWQYLDANPTLGMLASVGQGLIHHGKDLPEGAWTVEPYRKGRGEPGFADVPRDLAIYGVATEASVNLDNAVVRRPVAGAKTGIPQVLLNYHPVSREPWRLKAVIDKDGHAVTSSFLAIRPRDTSTPLEYLWAVLNSPLANAYAYCFLQKRNILAGRIRLLPLPPTRPDEIQLVVTAAQSYRDLAVRAHQGKAGSAGRSTRRTSGKRVSKGPEMFAAESGRASDQVDESAVRSALLRLDAAVLRLYDLSPRLERQLLDLFAGVERKGVGCEFRGYYPPGFTSYLPLHFVISDQFARAAADATAERYRPGESEQIRDLLRAASETKEE